MPPQVAVVGAGAAGAAAATAIDDVAEVTVFERDATVGGRSRTRDRGDCTYEIGANYLTPTDEAVRELVEDAVPDGDVLELDGEVWTFDASGDPTPSDRDPGARDRRLSFAGGLASLTQRLLDDADAEVVLDARVDGLERTSGDWRLFDGDDRDRGTFGAVVLTPPAPLSADLLGRSEWEHPDCRDLREAIASVPYRPIASAALHYPFELDRPWYALVDEAREHPIGWVGREDRKPGQVPDGETVLLVQCSSEFTIEQFDADPVDVVDRVATLTAGLVGDDRLADPDWTDVHCWRYAVPEAGLERGPQSAAGTHDLFLAGDWVVGEDRLNGALRSGLETGQRLREALG